MTHNNVSLPDFLKSLTDPRRKQGQRHQFDHVLSIVIMAILSGNQGIRGFARFAKANADDLDEVFHFKHGYPKFNTIRSVLMIIDHQQFISQFIIWAQDSVPAFPKSLLAWMVRLFERQRTVGIRNYRTLSPWSMPSARKVI